MQACLAARRPPSETGVVDEFPLNDQEILVRHLHKVVGDWVTDYQREQTPVGADHG